MDSSWRWSLSGYSSIEIVSILTLAIFFVIAKMKNKKTKQILSISITSLCIIATIHAYGNRHTQWHESRKENILSSRMYSSHLNVKPIYEALEMIPPDAAVSATNKVVPHLAYRAKIYVFPEIRDADYLVLLDDGNPFPLSEKDFYELREDYIQDEAWIEIFNEQEILILKKFNGNIIPQEISE